MCQVRRPLSDIGANSLLLAPDTFERSATTPNRLASIEQYARDGGGLLMIGGHLSFAGIQGKARYHDTRSRPPCPSPSAPSTTGPNTLRACIPPSPSPATRPRRRPGRTGRPARLQPADDKSAAQVLARCDNATRCSPSALTSRAAVPLRLRLRAHWRPPGFMAWPGYGRVWGDLLRWLTL